MKEETHIHGIPVEHITEEGRRNPALLLRAKEEAEALARQCQSRLTALYYFYNGDKERAIAAFVQEIRDDLRRDIVHKVP